MRSDLQIICDGLQNAVSSTLNLEFAYMTMILDSDGRYEGPPRRTVVPEPCITRYRGAHDAGADYTPLSGRGPDRTCGESGPRGVEWPAIAPRGRRPRSKGVRS